MKRTLLKRIVFLAVFLLSLVIIDLFLNKKNTDITMEMLPASLPVVSMELGEYKINTMYGYTQKREAAYTKDSLTPISSDRTVSLVVETFGSPVESISYEVRSIDGERLIEGNEITDYVREAGQIRFTLQLKDLIEENQEYAFVTILTLENDRQAYYYARFIQNEEYFTKEKLDYIVWFHDTIYGNGDGEELRRYLESDSQGDNTTFHKVDIHSSLKQVMWDELPVKKIGEPQIYIRDISQQTASAVMKYMVSAGDGNDADYYYVEEYYRIRYTPTRVYLLDYERTMDEFFSADRSAFWENRIRLGITSPDFILEETEGGKILAFTNCNRLFSYNTTDNKLAVVFSFYDQNNYDIRTMNRSSSIELLNIEDSGNLTFMVSGYMNRGNHEGRVGTAIYYYDSVMNLVEEQVFIPYEKSADILMEEIKNISYLNVNNHLFLILDGNLYDISLESREYEIIVSGLTEDTYKVSESQRMIVWQEENKTSNSSSLVWMNLNNGEQIKVRAGVYEHILALGFMGEDLVYGLAKRADIVVDSGGNTMIPIYRIKIQNQDRDTLKTYEKAGVYITDCHIEENQITLSRIEKEEGRKYKPIENDHIASNDVEDGKVNRINTVAVEVYGTIVQILLKSPVDTNSLKVLTPREVIYEGRREVVINEAGEIPIFYVYGPYGIELVCSTPSEAVTRAYEISGSVVDARGEYIWKKGTIFTRNQIMAIEGEKRSEGKSSLAVCLDTILELEGISRLTQPMLDRGEDALSILETGLRQAKILDLTGCALDTVLYYVDQDIPVLALLDDGGAVLVIGFNEQNVVLMDPTTGEVYKKGMNDSRTMFETNGNRFITFVRREEQGG